MRMDFALIFLLSNGEVDEIKTGYYVPKHHCVYMCQELSKSSKDDEAVDCVCRLTWVDNSERVIQ